MYVCKNFNSLTSLNNEIILLIRFWKEKMSAEVVHKTIEKKKWVSEEWQLGADAPRPP